VNAVSLSEKGRERLEEGQITFSPMCAARLCTKRQLVVYRVGVRNVRQCGLVLLVPAAYYS
jgi:hypothetical protein